MRYLGIAAALVVAAAIATFARYESFDPAPCGAAAFFCASPPPAFASSFGGSAVAFGGGGGGESFTETSEARRVRGCVQSAFRFTWLGH